VSGRQLAFDLDHRPALSAEDFLVGPSNQDAVAWIDAWPDWPGRALALYGPAGAGKTHLAQVWRARSGATMLDLDRLDPAAVPELAGETALAIEVGDTVPGERTLLHLLNLLRAEGRSVLLLSRAAPARWDVRLPDLASRLSAIACARLGPPDDTLFQAVLVKLFADRQVRPEPELIRFLVRRLDRSFAGAAAAVAWLDRAALEEQRPVNLSLARRIPGLSGEAGEGGAAHDSDDVIR
jgi:chromosomal replication initiation ATPase DnaA